MNSFDSAVKILNVFLLIGIACITCLPIASMTPEQTLLCVLFVFIQLLIILFNFLVFKGNEKYSFSFYFWQIIVIAYTVVCFGYVIFLTLDDVFSNEVAGMLVIIPASIVSILSFYHRVTSPYSDYAAVLKTGRFISGTHRINYEAREQLPQLVDGKSGDIYSTYVNKINKKSLIFVVSFIIFIFTTFSIHNFYFLLKYLIVYLAAESVLICIVFIASSSYGVDLYYVLKSAFTKNRNLSS
mgnify:CR=1 FL=1